MRKLNTVLVTGAIILASFNVSMAQNCRGIDARRQALPTLRKQIGDLEMVLDKTNAYIKLKGKTFRFTIPEDRVKKPGRNWVYFVNDIRSIPDRNVMSYKNGKFYLSMEFEGDKKEYKGRCPDCLKRFRDSRAPDFNWKSPRIAKITLKPKAYNNEIYFQVTNVDLSGKFEMGGKMDDFLLPMLNGMEIKLRNQMERQFRKILNDKAIRPQISKAFDAFVKMNGLKRVNSIYTSNNQLFFCEGSTLTNTNKKI